MDNLSQRIAALSPEKRELLLRQLNTIKRQQQEVAPQPVEPVGVRTGAVGTGRPQGIAPTAPVRVPKALDHMLQPVSREQPWPLSFAQERLWFLDQWNEGSAWYNIPLALRFSGPLVVSTLERSLRALVQRHEILRTTFEERSGRPVQVIAPCGACSQATNGFQIPVIDLRGWGGLERERPVRGLLRAGVGLSFDLAKGPLLRVYLLRLDEQEHILLCVLHHIITDNWSMEVLVREMTVLYQSEMNGQPTGQAQGTVPTIRDGQAQGAVPTLPELPIQYADYAIWQRQQLQSGVFDEQLAYWRKQLADLSPLELPTDYPRPRVKTDRGASQSHLLSPAIVETALHLCQREGMTLFMLLLSAFQVLLMRYTGQSDIAVGTPIANRTRAEIEGVIGFFANTLVMRTDLSGNPIFQQVLQQVRKICLEAYANQDMPFEKVVEELQPERDTSHSPLFQVIFVLQSTHRVVGIAPVRDQPEVSLTPLEIESTTSKFDLTLYLTETAPGGLACVLEYNTDLFEADTITRLLRNFQTLLQGIVQDPQARLADLPLLADAEREQVLAQGTGPTVQWDATRADYPHGACIHQLFERRVEQTSDSIALIFEEQQVTYQQLNSQANHLAHRLHTLGVGPEILVGIALPRSIEMVIALLAVLKAGGAYVPLDPALPQERLTHIIQDAQMVVLLTHSHLRKHLRADGIAIMTVDMEIEGQGNNPANATQPGNLLYLIYTSGSTGRPKGVLATHRATLNRLQWMWERFPFEADEVCCQKTSLSFVDSVWELFGPLLWGIRTVIISDEVLKDSHWFIDTLAREQITRIVLVPSLLRILLDTGIDLEHQLPCLKYWTSSGEALPVDLAGSFLKHLPQRVLLNLYGSSEVAADATCYDIRDWKEFPFVPIGRPIANTQIYLLDRNLSPVPIGVMGELYIGGEGLARGYANQPEQTAERFMANPWGSSPGERLYRTGDLARYRADGAIEYLGRRDQQVKLRGFRIELGEIEATLQMHPAVRQAVVVLREKNATRQYLVAYVTPAAASLETDALESSPSAMAGQAQGAVPTWHGEPPGQAQGAVPTASTLLDHLRERLPDYMVPAQVVFLEALPLLPNGKVDRHALPRPDSARLVLEVPFVPPQTPAEEVVAGIWAEILSVEQVGVSDNFFALGGHSLLAAQVTSRLREAFQIELSVRTLFERPTVDGLVCKVAELRGGRPIIEEIALIIKEIKQLSEEDMQNILYN